MATNNKKGQQFKELVDGYIRRMSDENSLIIPSVINQIIFDFYPKKRNIDEYDADKYIVSDNGTVIKGKGSCSGYFVYPNQHKDGMDKGVHYWSMKCIECVGCYRYIGIISERLGISMSKVETSVKLSEDSLQKYLFPRSSGHWKIGSIVTIRLDCNKWNIRYQHGDDVPIMKDIKKGKRYFFAFRMCAQAKNEFQCVETPKHHII